MGHHTNYTSGSKGADILSSPSIRTMLAPLTPSPAKAQMEPLNLKEIKFTVTCVSSQSPVRYHIEDEEDAVHVFLNRPLSRLDLGTLTEIFRKAEKPCHPTKIPASAPPSPNVYNVAVSNSKPGVPAPSSAPMKSPMSLFFTAFGSSSQEAPAPNTRQRHDSHINRGGKPRQILFYDKSKPHYGFTNFSDHPVLYKGHKYPTSEHVFQSMKVLVIADVTTLALTPVYLCSSWIASPMLQK